MHERLAHPMTAAFALTLVKVPFAFPVMQEMLQVHRARQQDPGLRWLPAKLKTEAGAPQHN